MLWTISIHGSLGESGNLWQERCVDGLGLFVSDWDQSFTSIGPCLGATWTNIDVW